MTNSTFYIFIFTGTLVGTHEAPIKCVEYCPEVNVIITGSWDSTVKLWDPRTPCAAGSFSQPDKVNIIIHLFLLFFISLDTFGLTLAMLLEKQ